MENEHWYAMYVKMHHEKKTAEKLDNMGVRNYLPLQETVKQWSDRKKKVKEVVIPMIIFIRTDEKTRIEVLKSVSSINGTMIDKATHKPAIIRDEEMERFMFMLDYSEDTVRFISEPLKPGEGGSGKRTAGRTDRGIYQYRREMPDVGKTEHAGMRSSGYAGRIP